MRMPAVHAFRAPRRVGLPLAIGVIALTAIGCAEEEAPAVEVSPCGEAECVLSHRPAWENGAGLRVANEPSLTLASVRSGDPESGFGVLAGLARLDDGTLVVADQMARQLHLFDASGDWVSTTGGPGEGPGEYVGLRWVARCWPDQLAAFDRQTLVRIGLDGEQLERTGLVELFGLRPFTYACNRNGVFAALEIDGAGWRGRVEAGIIRPDGEAVLMDVDAGRVVPLGRFPVGESHQRLSDAGFHPLGRVTQVAVGPGSVWVGTADTFEIAQYDLDGRLVRRMSRFWEPLDLDPAQVSELLDRALAELPPRAREFWRGRLGPNDNPPSLPAYDAMLADAAGRLWVREYRQPGETGNDWSVFDTAGVWLGNVSLPVGFTPVEIGADYLLGEAPDELDHPRVQLFALEGSA